MVSAHASSPPPFRFCPGDLRANARRFLERALVLSALVHLSVVGAVRVAEEWNAARAGREPRAVRVHLQPVEVLVPGLPTWILRPATPATSDKGMIIPTEKGVLFRDFTRVNPGKEPMAIPGDAPGGPGPDGPGPAPPPPDDPLPAFTVADTPPELIDAPKPPYPEWAREAGVEGKVLLRVLVGTDGRPKKVVVASGPVGLSDVAQKAVWRWRFRPGLSNGRPVEVWVEVPVGFRL